MKEFDVPVNYRSSIISAIKQQRKRDDKLKKDFSPTLLDLGALQIYLARHFGFCYGVENAIEIAFRTVDENPDKNIFLLSEMIHNPQVNQDLLSRGVKFLMDTKGNVRYPISDLKEDDLVLIPAFGTTLDIEKQLREKGMQVEKYNTTCPFVTKVWNRAEAIAGKSYSIVVHGKPGHEETRATFSHSAAKTPTVIVNDMAQTIELGKYILGEKPGGMFYDEFSGQYSPGFHLEKDTQRIGVVNQTTMLASDTQAIAEYLKQVMVKKYNLTEAETEERFADTRDTLCYATLDNQTSVYGMLETDADLAIVVGGYNSSNTSHLVELCEQKLPTYFINAANKLTSKSVVEHFDLHTHSEKTSNDYLPSEQPAKILITSGASCPDAVVEDVIRRLAEFYGVEGKLNTIIEQ